MKPFTDKYTQIAILKSRSLRFSDENRAKQLLMRYGYYEIINGYKELLLDNTSEKERYKDSATFEKLFALYELDKEIRNAVMRAVLEIELSLRTAIAYTLAEDFGVEKQDYLRLKNFRQGETHFSKDGPQVNDRQILLAKLSSIYNRNVEPLNHYRTVHGHIPPWILLKETTFGNLINLFKLFKGPQKDKVISICCGKPITAITPTFKELFNDTISVIYSFRNRAAHSGRMINFKSNKYTLRFNTEFHPKIGITPADYRRGMGKSDIYVLSKILDIFENEAAKMNLDYHLLFSIKEYCKLNSEDLAFIANEMSYPLNELQKEIAEI